jgi:integrase
LTKAVRWGFLGVHPLHKKVDHLPEDRDKEPRYLTPAEEKRLMKKLDARQEKQRKKRRSHNTFCEKRDYEPWPSLDDRVYTDYLKPMIELSLNTGLRQNEAFSLEWSDVDFTLERIAVRGVVAKTGKTRYVPLNEKALEVLKTWRAETEGDGLVFPSPNGGGKITNVQTAWERIRKKAKIENFVWHNLRSTFASRLVQSGVDLYVVMKLLGHKNISTTQRYSSLAPDQEKEAVARIVRPTNVVPFKPADLEEEADEAEAEG